MKYNSNISAPNSHKATFIVQSNNPNAPVIDFAKALTTEITRIKGETYINICSEKNIFFDNPMNTFAFGDGDNFYKAVDNAITSDSYIFTSSDINELLLNLDQKPRRSAEKFKRLIKVFPFLIKPFLEKYAKFSPKNQTS